GQVLPGGGLLLRGAHEVLDVLEVDPGQVGTPGGHRLLVEELQRLEPGLDHPLGLGLLLRDVADDLFVQAAPSGGAGLVGVGPAVLVCAEPFELGVRDRRHYADPPGLRRPVGLARRRRGSGGPGRYRRPRCLGVSRGWCRRRRRGRWSPAAAPGCRAGARRPPPPPRTAPGTPPPRAPPGSGAGTAAGRRRARAPRPRQPRSRRWSAPRRACAPSLEGARPPGAAGSGPPARRPGAARTR